MISIEDLRDGLSAQQCKALCAFGEARGEPVRGIVAVMNVVDNRVRLKQWGETVNEVVFAEKQFSAFNLTDINCAPLLAIGEAWLAGEHPEDDDIVLRTCLWLADEPLPDVTNGASHYVSATITKLPAWTQPPARLTTAIGRHRFYRLA